MAGPNVVLVLVDDLGWRDLQCYGSTFHQTPAIDRLAGEGVSFTDAYASSPVCSPTRASLLTGKYPARVGVTQFIGGHAVGRLCDVPYFDRLPAQELTLARALREGGYETWHVGKWHLGPRDSWPDRHGFDVNVAGCQWGHPYQGYFSPYGLPSLEDGPEGEYLTDRLTEEAIRLIRNRSGRPFFLNFWTYAVHTPIEAPADLVAEYKRRASALGLDQIDPFEEGEEFGFWQGRHGRVVRRLVQSDPAYAAMSANLDANVGRLLEALDEEAIAGETVVLFSSDNGGLATSEGSPTSNRPLAEGKGWMYDGGVRVPLIVRWPGVVAPGTVVDAPVTTPDLYPTVLEACGLPLRPRQHQDGVSLLPLLEGRDFSRGPIFWHYPHYSNQGGEPAAAVRDGALKLIRFYDGMRHELYDLAHDLSEEHDLASDRPDDVARLSAALDRFSSEVGCLLPRPNPYQEPFADFW